MWSLLLFLTPTLMMVVDVVFAMVIAGAIGNRYGSVLSAHATQL